MIDIHEKILTSKNLLKSEFQNLQNDVLTYIADPNQAEISGDQFGVNLIQANQMISFSKNANTSFVMILDLNTLAKIFI